MYLSMFLFIDYIFWPPMVIDIWRSRPPGSSEVNQGSQSGIGTPKNLCFDTSHDPFTLISYFDLFRGRYWMEVKLEVGYMCQYQHMMYELAKNVKTCLTNFKKVNLRGESGIFPYFPNHGCQNGGLWPPISNFRDP